MSDRVHKVYKIHKVQSFKLLKKIQFMPIDCKLKILFNILDLLRKSIYVKNN